MKDMLGQDLKVGDYIAYSRLVTNLNGSRSSILKHNKIIKIDEKYLHVYDEPLYNTIDCKDVIKINHQIRVAKNQFPEHFI